VPAFWLRIRTKQQAAYPRSKENIAKVHAAVLKNGGANWSAISNARLYLIDSKSCFGIIRAALSLLKSVDDFPHNPKVAGSKSSPQPIQSKVLMVEFWLYFWLHRPTQPRAKQKR
jgi:hypothetical protein